ncbi:hypothetical protein N7509_012005 [Penicillium cosmopolitanum]|uniref:Uncharacterized protein n=1 Tax=Penicillium cosmopolitanum TaxID=1131564 RepID=A0A9W9SHV5_9EURO|nr:uncharacterized protein N7509_012005 [Penicillium cosmopolitanum]KAJ5378886.1 hypothetical protein N7509_012005 [Penicillium cosmopolitanum]
MQVAPTTPEGGTAVLARKARPDMAKKSSLEVVGLKYGKAKKIRSLRDNLQKSDALKYKHVLSIILVYSVLDFTG